MNTMNIVNTLMNNKEFMKSIAMADTVEELQALFAANGLEMTIEEIEQALESVSAQPADGELSEESLDNVNGGVVVCGTILVTSAFVTFVGSAGKLALTYMTRR